MIIRKKVLLVQSESLSSQGFSLESLSSFNREASPSQVSCRVWEDVELPVKRESNNRTGSDTQKREKDVIL